MFLRNTVFPRDAVNPKGKFYPIFGRGAACAVGSIVGDVPVKQKCPVDLAPAGCMQRSRILAGFLKLAVFSTGVLRDSIALSCCGVFGDFARRVARHGRLWLVREAKRVSPARLYQAVRGSQAICDRGALCPVLASSSWMVCREPSVLFVG